LVPSPGNGLSTDPNFFPIGVWLQTATSNAQNYAAIGVNTFVGQYDGNSSSALGALKSAGEILIAPQDSVGLADTSGVIKGWQTQPDEPDNAQANGSGGYDPCIAPSTMLTQYNQMKAKDPSRPVYMNLGRAVADVNWIGRGTCTGDTASYVQYAKAADIVSFDIYPVNDGISLTMVATGVDNLRGWAGNKPLYAFIETTDMNGAGRQPTGAQIKAETFLALIHGANGIEYFCHTFSPSFIEAGCLAVPAAKAQMQADDALIKSLAPVLNDSTMTNGATASAGFRLDTLVKYHAGSRYIFSEAATSSAGAATFTVPGAGSGTVTVVGENRTLSMTSGTFTDSFAGWGVHIYQVT
jgi:hypothetical protein